MHAHSTVVLLGYVTGLAAAPATPDTHLGRHALAGLAAGVVLLLLGRVRGATSPRGRALRLFALGLLAFAGGSLNASHAWSRALGSPFRALGATLATTDRVVMLEGDLAADAEPAEYGARLTIAVSRIDAGDGPREMAGIVTVTVGGDQVHDRIGMWRGGRRVRVPVSARAGQRYRNPGMADPTMSQAVRGIDWNAAAKSALVVEVIGQGGALSELTAGLRQHARTWVSRAFAGLEAPATRHLHAGIVLAILIGDRSGLPQDVVEHLQRAGTFHVIAISGGNIAILTVLLSGLLRACRVGSRSAALVTLILIASYGLVAAGSPSVSRATLVAVLYLGGRVLDLRPHGFAVLRVAVLILLVRAPLALFDTGFVLTVAATIAVMGWGMALRGHARRPPEPQGIVQRVSRAVGDVVLATVAADLMLLPVAASAFSQVTVAGLVLNLIAIPLMTVVQVAGLVIVCAGPLSEALGSGAAQAAGAGVALLLGSASLVDSVPVLAWRVPPPPLVAIVSYYAAWFAWVALRRTGWSRASLAMLPATTACLIWIAIAPERWPGRVVGLPPLAGRLDDVLAAVFLDVGQGDATLLRFPSGRTWLVDCGGTPGNSTFDVGARVVVPALWALGVRRLDVVAVTHPDPDHAGGAPAVITDLRPRMVWEGVPVPPHPILGRMRTAAAREGSRWSHVWRGDRTDEGPVRISVLHPPRPDWERIRARNDDSVTFLVQYGRVRVLLPGDIGADVERELAVSIGGPGDGLTVLKAAHHGSGGSNTTAFLEAVRPSLAIVSAGRGNRFGHPSPAALARLKAVGAEVLDTAASGALAVLTDGRTVQVFGWSGEDWLETWARR